MTPETMGAGDSGGVKTLPGLVAPYNNFSAEDLAEIADIQKEFDTGKLIFPDKMRAYTYESTSVILKALLTETNYNYEHLAVSRGLKDEDLTRYWEYQDLKLRLRASLISGIPMVRRKPPVLGTDCGINTISFLTGMDTDVLKKMHSQFKEVCSEIPENMRNFTTKTMPIVLQKLFGFCVMELTASVVRHPNISFFTSLIQPAHVLLVCYRAVSNEYTWAVQWNNVLFHNFTAERITPMTSVNYPDRSYWLLTHPSWEISPVTKLERFMLVSGYDPLNARPGLTPISEVSEIDD